jgi:molybdate transport system substrate-binding protein
LFYICSPVTGVSNRRFKAQNQAMLKLISSMATRLLLAELAGQWQCATGVMVSIESVGGVDAARRVREGEAFDAVVLASNAIDSLISGGYAVPGSKVDLVRSGVAVAVKAGAAVPDISTEHALRRAIEAVPTIGYSTGPSGIALIKLFERWGMLKAVQSRIVQAPPGVPVGGLVARGEVHLGFQQLSELMGLSGITVVGLLPDPVGITTVFSAAACTASTKREDLTRLLVFMASNEAATVKLRRGMQAP